MKRPMYETEANLENERRAKQFLEERWSCVLHKVPLKYQVDWMAMRGDNPMAFIEYKFRENLSFYKYPRYMISLDKWMKAKQLSKEVEVPFVMVITFTEGTYYGSFDNTMTLEMKYGFGGRYDRGDAQDVEPMVFLPLNIFKKLI